MSYQTSYLIAAALLLVNVGIGAIQAVYAAGHGQDLGISPQLQAWLAVISTVIAAALALLPRVQRTPARRDAEYLAAAQGALPRDIAQKYPLVVPAEPVTDKPVGPPAPGSGSV